MRINATNFWRSRRQILLDGYDRSWSWKAIVKTHGHFAHIIEGALYFRHSSHWFARTKIEVCRDSLGWRRDSEEEEEQHPNIHLDVRDRLSPLSREDRRFSDRYFHIYWADHLINTVLIDNWFYFSHNDNFLQSWWDLRVTFPLSCKCMYNKTPSKCSILKHQLKIHYWWRWPGPGSDLFKIRIYSGSPYLSE